MPDGDGLTQARKQMDELIEAAESGALIPIRLPGQLRSIAVMIDQFMLEQNGKTEPSAPVVSVDVEELIRENGEFFKIAIHELRTPMTSIRGYSDMLGNSGMVGELTEMQAQLLQVVRANSKRMESLLTDMSYMNKIRANMLIANEKMDMFKNISMMIDKKMRPLAEELGRTLELDVPQGLPILTTDGELMSVAINKLIENGLRYCDRDDGKVTLSASADGNLLVITVSDNGIGMSEAELASLGTAFFRSDNDIVRSYKGSGLGVPIAYGIISALGGTYEVVSTPGNGTTFTLQFKGMT